MEWLDEIFKNPIGGKFWLMRRRKPNQYTFFRDKPPDYPEIARCVAVIELVVIKKMVVYGPEAEE